MDRICHWLEDPPLRKALLASAYRQVHNRDAAEDVLQDVLTRQIATRFGSYNSAYGDPLPWLHKIVQNRAKAKLREAAKAASVTLEAAEQKRAGQTSSVELHPLVVAMNPELEAMARENWRTFLRCVHEHPKHWDLIRPLLANEPVAAVAARFGLREDTVTQRKSRWLKKVRARFDELTGSNKF
jgi:DNA-directed RNA polymerase specialized sigma24 family protein